MIDLLWTVHDWTLPEALALLPGQMTSPAARALLLAIGLQESGFAKRRQMGGPARGFWQFEPSGVTAVLRHAQTQPIIGPICDLLLYARTTAVITPALEHQDVLAACFARLLLWTDPRPLPTAANPATGWAIYLAQWRPGEPRPNTWPGYFAQAWAMVGA